MKKTEFQVILKLHMTNNELMVIRNQQPSDDWDALGWVPGTCLGLVRKRCFSEVSLFPVERQCAFQGQGELLTVWPCQEKELRTELV